MRRSAAFLTTLVVTGSVLALLTPQRATRLTPVHASSGGMITLSGTPSVIAVDSMTARAYIGVHHFALGHVAIIDTLGRRVLCELDVGTPPLAIRLARRPHRVFVLTAGTDLTHGRGSLLLLDATSGAPLRSVPVGDNPNALAIDESRQRVLVTGYTASHAMVTIYNAADLTRVARRALDARARPLTVAAAAGRGLVLTSSGHAYLINDAIAQVMHVTPVGQGTALVAVDGRSGRAFVANQISNTVGVIDLATGTLLRTVGVGLTPSGLGVAATAQRVTVVNAADGTLTLLAERSGAPLRTVAVGAEPHGIAVDEQSNLAAIPTADGVSVVDATTGALLRRIAVGTGGAAVVAVSGQPVTVLAAPVNESAVRLLVLKSILRHAPQPAGPSVDRSLAVLRAFVDAYNTHDLQGVLSTLADDIRYGDCDYTGGITRILQGKGAVKAWLQARFAEHDRFLQAQIDVPHGPTFPRGASITAIRISDTVQAQGRLKWVGIKIGLTSGGGYLELVRMGGGPDCPSAIVGP
jgi:YVTN family beta-propeller protein